MSTFQPPKPQRSKSVSYDGTLEDKFSTIPIPIRRNSFSWGRTFSNSAFDLENDSQGSPMSPNSPIAPPNSFTTPHSEVFAKWRSLYVDQISPITGIEQSVQDLAKSPPSSTLSTSTTSTTTTTFSPQSSTNTTPKKTTSFTPQTNTTPPQKQRGDPMEKKILSCQFTDF